ncbi:branched-chain amino acid ABC transporter ATP-binding protein/permease [Rhizobium skierniewicense]|uniref:branched-chain amino acid ABC transporter ATP-binding protein/permease n=1 Tax=Rhizobium skierniewicense TaxID=984260 RepID=UPI001FADC9B5|nr:branched-chain amino acid ABC transporter ATP-binding protein/permease [Rhizobium skierniewicense]MCI9867540.1 branched-chain amino acid ABC transporter ATP-binding protein/permease [Rhizobium skierniewicense]
MNRTYLLSGLAIGLICLGFAPLVFDPFTITLLNYIGIYALVAIGLSLLTGVAGIVSFGQAAFVGVAAYTSAWVTTAAGGSAWLGLAAGLVLTCLCAFILGAMTLRLKGHFLSLSTIAWGLAIGFLFGNLETLGKHNGLANIPPISLGGYPLVSSGQIFYLIWVIVGLALLLVYNLLDSRAGRAMRMLRGGNTLVESLGIDPFRVKISCFVIAAALAAISGWLYAHMSRFVSPAPFEPLMGIEYLMMAMVGGAGSPLGGIIGAAIVTLLKNGIQDYLHYFVSGAGQLETVAFGVLFILFLQYSRQGLVPVLAPLLPRSRPPLPENAADLPERQRPKKGSLLLRVEEAERRFGGLVAVNKVSFDVKAGEILALIGPNGAGKSTMFNLLTGALALSSGRISFGELDIARSRQSTIARAGIGRTFQHVKLRPKMTLLENVMVGAYPRTRSGLFSAFLRLNRAEEAIVRHRALQELHRVGLGDKPFELAGNLPLGSQRVLEIARALASDPVLLVLDEPAAGLRRQEKIALADLLRSLRDESNLTILIVEHDMDFVMSLVDRIVVMDFGQRISEGTPEMIRNDPRVQEAYLGGVA